MERLTKRSTKTSHENGVCCTHFRSKECNEVYGNCAFGCKWEEETWSKLAAYEDLEEQGLLLRLPCKLGDDLYWISDEDDDGNPILTIKKEKHGINNILIDESGIFINTCDYPPSECDRLGGRYALLSRKEAEAKLKKLKKKVVE